MKFFILAVAVPSGKDVAISGKVLGKQMFFSCISFGLEQVCNSQKHEEFIECLRGLSMSFLTLFPSFAYLFDFQTLEEKHEIFFSSAGFFFIMCYFFLVIRFSKN